MILVAAIKIWIYENNILFFYRLLKRCCFAGFALAVWLNLGVWTEQLARYVVHFEVSAVTFKKGFNTLTVFNFSAVVCSVGFCGSPIRVLRYKQF